MNVKLFTNRLVVIVSAIGLASLLGACQAVATAVPTNPPADTPTPLPPPTITPIPTQSLIQEPIVLQPVIAPTTEALVMGTGVASGTNAPISTAAPKSLGQPQQSGRLSILPSSIGWQTQIGDEKAGDGNTFFIINISIVNTSASDNSQFEPAQFVLYDSKGKTYPLAAVSSANNQLKSTRLIAGDKVEGVLIYKIPAELQQDKWQLQFAGPGIPPLWSLN